MNHNNSSYLPQMKVLFLDFDGVINSYRGYRAARREKPLDYRISRFLYGILYSKPVKWTKKILGEENKYVRLFEYKFRETFWRYLSKDEGFHEYHFEWLKMLLDNHPDLHIVVSSVWRMEGMHHIRRLLSLHGIDPGRVISSTPSIDSYRGKEIQSWLKGFERNPDLRPFWYYQDKKQMIRNTPHEYHMRVTKFAIVDDDSDMEPFMDHFVQTDGHDGLGHKEYVKLNKILSGGENEVE